MAQPKNLNLTVATPIPAPSTGIDTIDQAMGILAEELDIHVSELSDETYLADFGVGSLLSLTISSRLKEGLNVKVESTVFAEWPSVKDSKQNFSNNCSPAPSTPESPSEVTASEILDK